MKKFYYIISVLMLFVTACNNEDTFSSEDNVPVNVVYQIQMADDVQGRAIGDGSQVDQLIVGVFCDGKFVNQFTFMDEADGTKDRIFSNVAIPMMTKETYDLVFWAQKSGNGIYTFDDGFNVTIDYSKYTSVSVINNYDAFTGQQRGVSVVYPGKRNIDLTRPFAQLNILATQKESVNKVSFTIDKVYTVYNPYSDEVTTGKQTFSITPDGEYTTRIDATNYDYLASIYLLAPVEVTLTGGLYDGNETKIKDISVSKLPLNANKRTNLLYELRTN